MDWLAAQTPFFAHLLPGPPHISPMPRKAWVRDHFPALGNPEKLAPYWVPNQFSIHISEMNKHIAYSSVAVSCRDGEWPAWCLSSCALEVAITSLTYLSLALSHTSFPEIRILVGARLPACEMHTCTLDPTGDCWFCQQTSFFFLAYFLFAE